MLGLHTHKYLLACWSLFTRNVPCALNTFSKAEHSLGTKPRKNCDFKTIAMLNLNDLTFSISCKTKGIVFTSQQAKYQ